MKIAVAILNWNGKELLERFLPSVIEYSDKAQIYIIDNASTDDSIHFCATQYPKTVTVIQNSNNLGYAGGYNEGLKTIDADIYVLLNSDVKVTKGWLDPFINAFDKNPKLAAAQPKIKDLNKPEFFEYAGAAGGFLDVLGYPFCRGRIFNHCEKDEGQYNDTINIHWASGACLFVRADVFRKVGGFDASYFAHQEEIDLCWRIRNEGYTIQAIGGSEVFHLGGGTLSSSNPKKTFYNFRNSLFTLLKNATTKVAILAISQRLILDGIAGIYFLFQSKPKHTWSIVKAHFSFYTYFRVMSNKRKTFQQSPTAIQYPSILVPYFLKKIKTFDALTKKK